MKERDGRIMEKARSLIPSEQSGHPGRSRRVSYVDVSPSGNNSSLSEFVSGRGSSLAKPGANN